MINPVQPLNSLSFKSQNTPNQNNTSVKKEEENKFSIEWHCTRCDRYFKVPKITKDDNNIIKKFNCPYCNCSIENNYKNKGDNEWDV